MKNGTLRLKTKSLFMKGGFVFLFWNTDIISQSSIIGLSMPSSSVTFGDTFSPGEGIGTDALLYNQISIESLDKTKKHFRQSLLRGRRGTTAVVDEEDIMLSIYFDLSILTTKKGISLFGKIPFVFTLKPANKLFAGF